jgi:hypothetical protein
VLKAAIVLLANSFTIDLILLGVALESVALLAYRRSTGKGLAPRAVCANLLSGGSLLLALRVALQTSVLAQQASALIALFLAMALLAHVADLATRWERTSAH